METLHLWVTGLCTAAVISAVVTVLTPSGALEKSIKSVISVFLICAMIMPFFKAKININNNSSIILDESNETATDMNEAVCEQTENYLKSTVEEVLEKNGISFREVIIDMKIEDDNISVNSVTVSGVDKDAQTVKDILYKELSLNAEVIQ